MTNPEMTERGQIVAYLRLCAEAFREVPLEAGGDRETYLYSLDAVLRIHNLANAIERGDHLQESASVGR